MIYISQGSLPFVVGYTLAFLNLLLFLISMIQFIRILLNERELAVRVKALSLISNGTWNPKESFRRQKRWNWKKAFHAIIIVCTLVRGLFFIFQPWYTERDDNISWIDSLYVVWYQWGSALFLAAYFMLLLFWGDFYYQVNGRTDTCFGRMKTILCSFLFIVLCSLSTFVLLAFGWAKDGTRMAWLDLISSAVIGVLSILISLAFLYYGILLYLGLSKYRVFNATKVAQTFKVGSVAFVCTVCFATRASLVLYSLLKAINDQSFERNFDLAWFWVLIFFFIFEVLPIALMLFLLRKLPNWKEDPSLSSDPPTLYSIG